MVEPNPRGKSPIASLDQRRAMVLLALQDELNFELAPNEFGDQFSVSGQLPQLQQRYGTELFLLMGTDIYKSVTYWPDYALLQQAMQLVVGVREGDDVPTFLATSTKNPLVITHALPGVAATHIRSGRHAPEIHLHTQVAKFAKQYKIYSKK